jgi:trigger factor
MKVDIDDLSAVRKKMTLEVPAEEVDRTFKQAVGRIARKVRIPGFRKGKAPADVIRQRFAKELREEVEETITQRSAEAAFKERAIEPVGRPVLEELHLAEGEPFRMTLLYEIRPEITPGDYLGQEVARSIEEVTTEDVQNELRRLQEAHAYLVPVEGRGAEKDDAVLVDLEGTDPASGKGLQHEGVTMVVDGENNLPAFNEALRGRRPGDEATAEVSYPDDYHAKNLAGKKVAYTLTVRELKRREMPDLDDGFAKDAGGFESLAALRDEVRKRLEEVRNAQADRVAKDRLLGKVADAHDFEVPEALVEAQIDARMQDLVGSLLAQGMDPRREDIDWKKIRDEQRDPARGAVKRMLLLDAIAEKEGLEIAPEEVDRQIERAAKARQESPQAFRNRLRKEGNLEAFQNQLLREKCLDFVFDAAKIS